MFPFHFVFLFLIRKYDSRIVSFPYTFNKIWKLFIVQLLIYPPHAPPPSYCILFIENLYILSRLFFNSYNLRNFLSRCYLLFNQICSSLMSHLYFPGEYGFVVSCKRKVYRVYNKQPEGLEGMEWKMNLV